MDIAKESGKKITLESLAERLDILEEKMRSRDKPVSKPDLKNHNTDPGPWVKVKKD